MARSAADEIGCLRKTSLRRSQGIEAFGMQQVLPSPTRRGRNRHVGSGDKHANRIARDEDGGRNVTATKPPNLTGPAHFTASAPLVGQTLCGYW
jgi:hypothetical protein